MIDHRPMAKHLLLTVLMGTTVVLLACGQVITPEPTRPSLPRNTPTATLATPRHLPTTKAPPSAIQDTTTPTVTPTPIVHVVQKGDTLQAIAFDFGVSVEALQRVNGIDNPQFLQVGQRLVIPVREERGEMTAGLLLPTPTPQPIQVQGVAFYETPVDSLLCLGEVANTTALTLTNVQVEVALLDANDGSLIETNTFVATDIVPPGARSPFQVLFTTPPLDWVSYQVTIIRGQEAGALAAGYVPMSVIRAEGNLSGPQFQVRGAFENASTGRIAKSVDIFVTTYDAEGTITGFRQSTLTLDTVEGGLPPGGELAFSLSLATHGDVPADFAVVALGRAADGMTSGG